MLEDIKVTFYFDQSIKVTTGLTVYGHGHCVVGFGMINYITGEEIIPFVNYFNLEKIEVFQDLFKIIFRIYPDGAQFYEIELNPFEKTFRYSGNIYSTVNYLSIITGK